MKKNTITVLILILAVICKNVEAMNEFGFDSFSHEIESELIEETPSLVKPEMLKRVTGLFLNKITALNRFATIIDADESLQDGDHFSKCVRQRREDVKKILKPGITSFLNDCYSSLHNEFTTSFKPLFEKLSLVTVTEEMELTEACMAPLGTLPAGEMEKHMGTVLKCLGDIKYTDTEVREFVAEYTKTQREIQEGSQQRGNQCFNKLVTKLRRQAGDLNTELEKCSETLRQLKEDEETSHEHTKESVDAYYKKLYVKVEEYIEEMRSALQLERCKDSTVQATEFVTKGIDTLKELEETLVIGEDGSAEDLENWNDIRTEILEAGEAGLNHCANAVKRIQKHLNETKDGIEETIQEISVSMMEHLEDCRSEGLVKSATCLYQFDINLRENYDEDMKPLVEQSRLWLIKEDFVFIEERVQTCVDGVLEALNEHAETLQKKMRGEEVEEQKEREEL